MTQTMKVLNYMVRHQEGITPLEAITELGCFRLAARISDLSRAGYKIEREMVRTTNRDGESVHFARYKLARGVKDGEAIYQVV